MPHLPTSRTPNSHGSRDEKRPTAIVEALRKGLSSPEVFEAFEELDAFPEAVVRDALVSWTGPAPNPDALDAETRRAHGFAARALVLVPIRAKKPTNAGSLTAQEREQIRRAGLAWDGLELDAAERLRPAQNDASFADAIELRTFADDDGTPRFDVVLYKNGSGTIFRTGADAVVGAIADGIVELHDRRERTALQEALTKPVTMISEQPNVPKVPNVKETKEPKAKAAEPKTVAKAAKKVEAPEKAPKKVKKKAAAAKKTTSLAKVATKKAATKKAAATKPTKAKVAKPKAATKAKKKPVATVTRSVTKKKAATAKPKSTKKTSAAKGVKKPLGKKTAAAAKSKVASKPKTVARKPVAKKAANVVKKKGSAASAKKKAGASRARTRR